MSTCRQNKYTDLQKGRFLQHGDELGEVVSNLLIHRTHQAHLPHGAGTVRPLGIRPLHLQEGAQRGRDQSHALLLVAVSKHEASVVAAQRVSFPTTPAFNEAPS